MATVLTNRAGTVLVGFPTGGGVVQQFGNFPRYDQAVDEPGADFESSAVYSRSGLFQFSDALCSSGQQVLFDVAVNDTGRAYATNVRVP